MIFDLSNHLGTCACTLWDDDGARLMFLDAGSAYLSLDRRRLRIDVCAGDRLSQSKIENLLAGGLRALHAVDGIPVWSIVDASAVKPDVPSPRRNAAFHQA